MGWRTHRRRARCALGVRAASEPEGVRNDPLKGLGSCSGTLGEGGRKPGFTVDGTRSGSKGHSVTGEWYRHGTAADSKQSPRLAREGDTGHSDGSDDIVFVSVQT